MTAIYLLLLAAVVTRVAALFVRRLLLSKEECIRISPDDHRKGQSVQSCYY
jgi:hypothetical protein